MGMSESWVAIWFVGGGAMAFLLWFESMHSGSMAPWTYRGVTVFRRSFAVSGTTSRNLILGSAAVDQIDGKKVLVRSKAVSQDKTLVFAEIPYGNTGAGASCYMPFRGVIIQEEAGGRFVLRVILSWSNIIAAAVFVSLMVLQHGPNGAFSILFPVIVGIGMGMFAVVRLCNYMDYLIESLSSDSGVAK